MTEWRKCSVCKKPINLGEIYQKCSVSTCRKNAYCSVKCWDVHVPILNHKSAWAEENTAPKTLEAEKADQPRSRIVVSDKNAAKTIGHNSHLPKDVLVVISKLKSYIKAKADMNTSGDVSDILSDIIRMYCDEAIHQAQADGRKTVMARDFKTKN